MIEPAAAGLFGARLHWDRKEPSTLTFAVDASIDTTVRVSVPVAMALPGLPSAEAFAEYVHESPVCQAGFSIAGTWGGVPPSPPVPGAFGFVPGFDSETRFAGPTATAKIAAATTKIDPARTPSVLRCIPSASAKRRSQDETSNRLFGHYLTVMKQLYRSLGHPTNSIRVGSCAPSV